ncbi:MAG: NERD domain-containing protein, partial [Anaerolineales bacterium]|nr:NERD domain-containing protein [Anaerolineales bacterium]
TSATIEDQLAAVLSDGESLVAHPILRGETLDCVVVAEQALFVLHLRDWKGQIRPAARGAWRQRLDTGEVITHTNPKSAVRRKEQAVQRFLTSAFPSNRVTCHHLVVLSDPSAQVFLHGTADPPVVELANLRSEMDSLMLTSRGDVLDATLREALAEALTSRAYQTFELANQPFIFRSGGFFGFGKRAHTIQQVIKHLEQHPQDGIYHLWNGSLAQWLREQGATRLADLAVQAIRHPESERIALESFLQQSGLVERPRLVQRPRRLNFHHVGVGERAAMIWRIRKGRGRGYLHGSALSRTHWLQISPGTFEGELDATVSVDTEAIPITERPARGHMELSTNATEQPMDVEVFVNVRSMPSTFERRVVRPLVGLVLGAVVGALIGLALHALGLDEGLADWLKTRIPQLPPIVSNQALAALSGLMWAILGFIRGWHQRWAWPTWYATLRWLGRTFAWMTGLAIAVAATYILLRWLFPVLETWATRNSLIHAALLGSMLGVIPGSIGEIRASHSRAILNAEQHRARNAVRRGAWVLVAVGFLVLVVGGVRFFAPQVTVQGAAEEGRSRLEVWMDARESDLQDLRD